MKAIIYTRFSPRRNPEDCESCESQRAACEEYCKKHGHEVAGYFEDRGASGSDENRPGFWAAMAAMRHGWALIVWKFDRLARDVYLHCVVERHVLSLKGSLISASGEGEISKNLPVEQKLMLDIVRAFTAYERRVISARTSAAMRRRQNSGQRMSSNPPFGFRIDPNNPNALVDDPHEQDAIKLILKLTREGKSSRAVAKELKAQNFACRGPLGWRSMTVLRTLGRLRRNGIEVSRIPVGRPAQGSPAASEPEPKPMAIQGENESW